MRSSLPALVSSPAAVLPPLRRPHRRCRFFLRPTCASRSCDVARGCSERYQPRLVAAQSPPPLAAGAVRRDAETGLALLLFLLSVVMSFFLLLAILSFSACRAFQRLETTVNELSKVVAEGVPGTLSALKLSFLEINDLTSQLKNLRKRLTLSTFGKESSIKASSWTGWPKQQDT
ncbi:uncharacterized protein LOC133885220 [Phragmites australis]|uniref:uncharacterized protein LOC133885220 n=1 Tax=Phragmites australis TaxID=29695 RepID=UPI002D785631|nr:uncharacterized protein LOC133885220 [Phragmites australis]XP_062180880.1 uncharacterized protein LOC133885220 [Phragmites australis]